MCNRVQVHAIRSPVTLNIDVIVADWKMSLVWPCCEAVMHSGKLSGWLKVVHLVYF